MDIFNSIKIMFGRSTKVSDKVIPVESGCPNRNSKDQDECVKDVEEIEMVAFKSSEDTSDLSYRTRNDTRAVCGRTEMVLDLRSSDFWTHRNRYGNRLVDILRQQEFGIANLLLRGSKFQPSRFFEDMDKSSMEGLELLELNHAVFNEDWRRGEEVFGPELNNLKELYLERVLRGWTAYSLEDFLRFSPKLKVLDLERAELDEGDIALIARLLPDLQELYLGYTGLGDASCLELTRARLRLQRLAVVCLSGTRVSRLGVKHLIGACPALRSLTVSSSQVREKTTKALGRSLPGLKIRRAEVGSFFDFLSDQTCGHFDLKYRLSPVMT